MEVVWTVQGPVSEGKSTLFNALTDIELSPIGIVETTMSPLVFAHGKPGILIHYADGTTADEHLDALKHYTGDAAKAVETIEVFIPSVPEGLQIVDLPGEGSLLDEGSSLMAGKIADQKAKSDVVINVLTSTSRVPSPTSTAQRVYFIFNKVDTLVTPVSFERGIDTEVERLRAVLALNGYDDEVRVFACSPVAYLASKNLEDTAFKEILAFSKWCHQESDAQILKAFLDPITCLSRDILDAPMSRTERKLLVASLSEQHGWSIFRIALLLSWHLPGMDVRQLKQQLREFSGIDALRTALLQDSEPERVMPLRAARVNNKTAAERARKLSTLQNRINKMRNSVEHGGVYDMKKVLADTIKDLEADAAHLSAEVDIEEAVSPLPDSNFHESLAAHWLAENVSDSETTPPSLVVATIEDTRESIQVTWMHLTYVADDACYQQADPDTDTDGIFTSIPLPKSPTAKDLERVAAPGLVRVKRCVASVGAEVLLVAADTADTLRSTLETLLTGTPVRIATCKLADAPKGAPPRKRPSLIVDAHLRQVDEALRTGNIHTAHLQLQQAKKLAVNAKHDPNAKQIIEQYENVLLAAVKSAADAATGIQKEHLLMLRATLECEKVPKDALPELFESIANDFQPGSRAAQDMRLIAEFFKGN